MNGNGQLVERLAESEVYKTYEEAFVDATGLPLAVRGIETWKLPLHGKRNENRFCAMMAELSKTCAACLQMQECLAKSAMNGPATVTCRYGLCEAAAPIKLGEETIGFLQTGQVLDRQPTETGFEKVMSKARDVGVELDKERARGAWFSTPVMSRKKLNSTMTMLWIFAQYLATKSHEITMREAHAEPPPAITRAKKYIEEHYGEDLSLSSVSEAVNMSLFYFCKLFHKSSGMSFTEFVSRTRIEKAKNLLLNPNLRVSEIGYDVGFQSLTHFNRVFRKLVGKSPTEYRCHLRLPQRASRSPSVSITNPPNHSC